MLGKNKAAIIAAAIVGILAGASIIIMLPSSTPYSVINTGGNGLSQLALSLNATPLRTSIGEAPSDPGESALIIIQQGPSTGLTVKTAVDFAMRGGLVIVSGDYYFLQSFAQETDLPVSVREAPILDPIMNAGDRFHPLLYSSSCPYRLIGYKPYVLSAEETAKAIAVSSDYSYVDENGNGFLDLTEGIDSYVTGVQVRVGEGAIIVFSSPDSFTNEYIGGNLDFIKCLLGGRRVFIDQSQPLSNPLEAIKLSIRYSSSYNLRIIITVLAVVSGVIGYIVSEKYYK